MATGRAIKAGEAFIQLTLKGGEKLQQGLARVGRLAGVAGKALAGMGVALAGLATTGIVKSITKFRELGDQMDKMRARTGLTAESLSQLGFAAEQGGASIDQLDRSLAAMARFSIMVERNLSTATDVLEMLNIGIAEFQQAEPEERFLMIAEALAQQEDATKRAGLALKIFGRSGRELLPMLAGGRAGIKALMEEADALGRTITEDQATAAAELTDAWNEMLSSVQGMMIEVGASMAPMVTRMLDTMRDFAMDWEHWTAELRLYWARFIKDIADLYVKFINGVLAGMNKVASWMGQGDQFFLSDTADNITDWTGAYYQEAIDSFNEAQSRVRRSEQFKAAREANMAPAETLAEVVEEVKRSVAGASIGAFGARAEQLGVNSIARRQLRAAEETAKSNEQIRKLIESRGLAFL